MHRTDVMSRADLDHARDRIADASPLVRALLARLASAAYDNDGPAITGTLDDLRGIIEGLAGEAMHLLAAYEAARMHAPASGGLDIKAVA